MIFLFFFFSFCVLVFDAQFAVSQGDIPQETKESSLRGFCEAHSDSSTGLLMTVVT
jgi:hypothetical protein